ncbi:MAG TPA: AsmA-like C-terminal region-containing protein, partial [Longimicrobiales bacterium]|nr:AsmA-like C-terminal region-containing protein [Longimicrobiales bacterium]
GTANWNIGRPSTDAEPGGDRPISVSLRRLEVHEGALRLENRQANLHVSATGLRESLRGDFSRERFTLTTRTNADTVSLRFAGVPYLSRARLQVAADLDVDMDERRVEISENEIRLNELVLRARGAVAAAEDSVAVDLAFSTPGTAFADILSLVPAVYTQSFATLQSSGTMVVSGTVRGGYGAHTFPSIALAAKVENGMFRYPDLPLPARDVSLDLAVHNPGGDADSTTVTLHRLHLVLGGDPIDGSFVLRTPVSDPDLALHLKGRLDLANLGRTVKLENIEELSGVIVADAHMRARRSDVDAERYGQISAGGGITVTALELRGAELRHDLRIDEAGLRFTPAYAELTSLRATIGRSDAQVTGRLDNLLGFALYEQELRGETRVTSRYLDLDEWRSDDETRAVPVPRNIDFRLQAAVDRITFAELELRNARGALRVKDQRVTLEDFGMDMLDGAVAVSGFYETTDPARPTFNVDVAARELDIQATFAGLRTVQAFAPVARYARGSVSTDLELRGALGADMMPVREVLSGMGSLRTMGVVLQDFPPLDRLADALHVDLLRDPGLKDLTSTIEIRDGRLHVQPFDVGVGPLTMSVAGSNGFDHSLAYTLGLQLPRALLGTEANRVVANLLARAGRSGVELEAAETVTLGVQLGGTVTDPAVTTSLRDVAGSAVAGVEQALRAEAGSRVDSARQRLDAAAAEARLRAQEIIAEAEQRAAAIRAEARTLAATMKQETKARADSLVARAGNPVARVAAQAAADRLRRETDEQADGIVREADARADALVAEARRRAAAPDSAAAP